MRNESDLDPARCETSPVAGFFKVALEQKDGTQMNKCEWCGKAPEIEGVKLCRSCNDANYQEPDFERLLEAQRDAEAVRRDGFGNEWSL